MVTALDLDSHEFIPTHMWADIFGPVGQRMEEAWRARKLGVAVEARTDFNNLVRPDITADTAPIDPRTIWSVKGASAPGAIDMGRRGEVLTAMGIERQLVFPNFGFVGMGLASQSTEYFEKLFTGFKPGEIDHRRLGLDAMRAHNDWLLKAEGWDPRLRMVAVVPTFDLDDAMAEAKRMIDGGARALWIPASVPPGGTSPANDRMDPFWAMTEEADVAVVLHLGTEPFLPMAWRDCPAFAKDYETEELPSLDPYFMTVFYFAVENFLASMVMGGVFERHPRLRFGVIECGAAWVGPLVERMETFTDFFAATRRLRRRPTEVVAEQVRVTPYWFDRTDLFIERNPELASVYCYSSDYPHVEGGCDSMQRMYERIAPLGDEMVEKFFRTNAELLLPW